MNQPTLENDRDALADFIGAQLRGVEAREGQAVAMAAGQAVSGALMRLAEAAGVPVRAQEAPAEPPPAE